MQSNDEAIAQELPEALWSFVNEACHLRGDRIERLPPEDLPEPERSLLVHRRDMTSTLAAFHRSALRVDVLQQQQLGELYLREVFLRAADATDRIVEYGVLAVALEQFTSIQQAAIRAGERPLGGLLHEFRIAFRSRPICFFSVSSSTLEEPHRFARNDTLNYGRFNRLMKPTGEALAWIMEILPRPEA